MILSGSSILTEPAKLLFAPYTNSPTCHTTDIEPPWNAFHRDCGIDQGYTRSTLIFIAVFDSLLTLLNNLPLELVSFIDKATTAGFFLPSRHPSWTHWPCRHRNSFSVLPRQWQKYIFPYSRRKSGFATLLTRTQKVVPQMQNIKNCKESLCPSYRLTIDFLLKASSGLSTKWIAFTTSTLS